MAAGSASLAISPWMTFTRFSAISTVQGWPNLPIVNQRCRFPMRHL
jgi:hypothetical protein